MDDKEKINILVVDDLPEKLLVYRTVLEELGQHLVTATSGEEALKQVLQHDFAVILLDVNMPGMDGFETASLIRRRRRSRHTPIIFVTAFLDEVRPVQGYSYGAVDYMLAPVVPEVLRAKVKVFVELFRMHREVERQAQARIALAEERAKRAAAEQAGRASAFLAEASQALAKSMNFADTLRELARVAVPFLADLSIACLVDESRRPAHAAWAWKGTNGEVVQPHTVGLSLSSGLLPAIERVLATGKMESLPHAEAPARPLGARLLAAFKGQSDPHPDFELDAAVILPLTARGKTLGALTLGRADRAGGGATDLGLAEDLACRAGIALDNALLVRDIQEADRRKDEFLAMLSHELRNPLAPIRNALHILAVEGSERPTALRAREMMERQFLLLVRLVDELLDVSRIMRGQIQLRKGRVLLRSVVERAIETAQPLIDAQEHHLEVHLPPAPVWLDADHDRLAQVIANLLNNAAKYSERAGRIALSASLGNREVVLHVKDNGIGIAPEVLPHIFDLFMQAPRSIDRSQGGLGIGLTLVRRLVELHGGTVAAFSEGLGKGSEFVVHLPALAEEGEARAEAPAVPVEDANSRFRVLVVDDNIDAAESLAMLIRLHGHEVCTAHDGLTALAEAEAFHPRIVFLDIGMDGLDGYEVARRLRSQPLAEQPILAAVTGYGREEDRFRSEEAGFDLHVVKPIDPGTLLQILASPETFISGESGIRA